MQSTISSFAATLSYPRTSPLTFLPAGPPPTTAPSSPPSTSPAGTPPTSLAAAVAPYHPSPHRMSLGNLARMRITLTFASFRIGSQPPSPPTHPSPRFVRPKSSSPPSLQPAPWPRLDAASEHKMAGLLPSPLFSSIKASFRNSDVISLDLASAPYGLHPPSSRRASPLYSHSGNGTSGLSPEQTLNTTTSCTSPARAPTSGHLHRSRPYGRLSASRSTVLANSSTVEDAPSSLHSFGKMQRDTHTFD